jgi:hypothetical protein
MRILVIYYHLLQLVLGEFVRHGTSAGLLANLGAVRPWDSLRHTESLDCGLCSCD